MLRSSCRRQPPPLWTLEPVCGQINGSGNCGGKGGGSDWAPRGRSISIRKDEGSPCMPFNHRRRIKTEEKAKVVAAVWGQNLFKSLTRYVVQG